MTTTTTRPSQPSPCLFLSSTGVPASQKWLERCTQLAAEHAAAGAFSSAMSLLYRQLGVVAFEPLKPHMLELYNASHAVLPGLQVRACVCLVLLCVWQFSSFTHFCWRQAHACSVFLLAFPHTMPPHSHSHVFNSNKPHQPCWPALTATPACTHPLFTTLSVSHTFAHSSLTCF